jgi:hypothetical protein
MFKRILNGVFEFAGFWTRIVVVILLLIVAILIGPILLYRTLLGIAGPVRDENNVLITSAMNHTGRVGLFFVTIGLNLMWVAYLAMTIAIQIQGV